MLKNVVSTAVAAAVADVAAPVVVSAGTAAVAAAGAAAAVGAPTLGRLARGGGVGGPRPAASAALEESLRDREGRMVCVAVFPRRVCVRLWCVCVRVCCMRKQYVRWDLIYGKGILHL